MKLSKKALFKIHSSKSTSLITLSLKFASSKLLFLISVLYNLDCTKLQPINFEPSILHLTKSELLKLTFEKSQFINKQSVKKVFSNSPLILHFINLQKI